MTRLLPILAVCITSLCFTRTASAQVPPFFNNRAALFDPEISILNTGVLNDVQATVSADRKYVTMNMRVSNSELVALREFSFQNGGGGPVGNLPQGFVGDPAPAPGVAANGGNAGGGANAGVNADPNAGAGGANPPLPSEVRNGRNAAGRAQRDSILTREGMTLVGNANAARRAGAP
jgi:hypothetical protein